MNKIPIKALIYKANKSIKEVAAELELTEYEVNLLIDEGNLTIKQLEKIYHFIEMPISPPGQGCYNVEQEGTKNVFGVNSRIYNICVTQNFIFRPG